jgi:uncharacterized paraquat-inducible protein A
MSNYFKMGSDYLVAKFGGETLPEDAMTRLETCMTCEFRVEKEEHYYCRECGCPQVRFWPDSELRKKVTMLRAKCPKNKW